VQWRSQRCCGSGKFAEPYNWALSRSGGDLLRKRSDPKLQCGSGRRVPYPLERREVPNALQRCVNVHIAVPKSGWRSRTQHRRREATMQLMTTAFMQVRYCVPACALRRGSAACGRKSYGVMCTPAEASSVLPSVRHVSYTLYMVRGKCLSKTWTTVRGLTGIVFGVCAGGGS
jgi:hypothetical protein